MVAGTYCTVAACATVNIVPSGTTASSVPLPSLSYISWPWLALGPPVTVTPTTVPSLSVPFSGTPIGVSSTGLIVAASATGTALVPTVTVSVPSLVVVPSLSV